MGIIIRFIDLNMALSSSTMGKDTLEIDSFSSYQNTNYKLHFFFFADFVIFAIQVSRDAPHLTNKKVHTINKFK